MLLKILTFRTSNQTLHENIESFHFPIQTTTNYNLIANKSTGLNDLYKDKTMENLVIAVFRIRRGKMEEATALLRKILPETRRYEGCISLQLFLNEETRTYTLVEDWKSLTHYNKYVDWRMETGVFDLFDSLIEGGSEGIDIQRHGESVASY